MWDSKNGIGWEQGWDGIKAVLGVGLNSAWDGWERVQDWGRDGTGVRKVGAVAERLGNGMGVVWETRWDMGRYDERR